MDKQDGQMSKKERQDVVNVLSQLDKVQEAAAKEVENAPEELKPAVPTMCSRCGHNLGTAVLTATDEEKEAYTRSILGGTTYEKKYTLFGGRVHMTFETLTNKESDVLGGILAQLVGEDPVKRTTEALKIKLLFYLRKYNNKEYERPAEHMLREDALKEADNRFGDMSENLFTIVIKTYQEFYTLVRVLSDSAFDEAFYEGAGLA
jgi:hypothetical protein